MARSSWSPHPSQWHVTEDFSVRSEIVKGKKNKSQWTCTLPSYLLNKKTINRLSQICTKSRKTALLGKLLKISKQKEW